MGGERDGSTHVTAPARPPDEVQRDERNKAAHVLRDALPQSRKQISLHVLRVPPLEDVGPEAIVSISLRRVQQGLLRQLQIDKVVVGCTLRDLVRVVLGGESAESRLNGPVVSQR